MTSTTLTSKNTFLPAFRKSAKKGLGDIIAVSALAVIVPLLALAVTLYNNTFGVTSKTEYDATIGALIVLAIMTVISSVFSFFIGPKLFKEIYKKQSCDLYFSLPIKRENYFFAGYLFGAMVNIAATVLPTILYSLLAIAMSTKYVTITLEFGALFRVLIPVVLAILTEYTAFIMCAVTSGRRIHYYLLALICAGSVSSGLSGILTTVNAIWGYNVKSTLLLCIDPTVNAVYSVMNETIGMRVLGCAIMVIEIAAMIAAGAIIFKRRKAEVAEVTLTGKIVPYILLALLALSGYMRYAGNTPIIAVIAGCILAVLFAMAFTGIFYKKVFTKKTGITVGAICLACTLLVGAVNLPSYSSYVKKLPEASEVESIEINNNISDNLFVSSVNSIMEIYMYGFDYMNDFEEYDISFNNKITTEEGIAAAIKLHEKLIDDKVISESKNYTTTALISMLFNPDEYYNGDISMLYDIGITYHLKSGKTISRTYSVDQKLILKEYYELAKCDEMLNQAAKLNISEDNILALNAYSYVDYSDYEYDYEYYDDEQTVPDTLDLGDNEDNEYVDEYLGTEHWSKIKGALISDLKQMEQSKFLCRYDELNDFGGISDESYIDSYYQCALVNVLTLRADTPEDIAKELKSMPAEKLFTAYDNYMYTETDYAFMAGDESVDKSKLSKFAYVDNIEINIYNDEKATLDYFKSIGLEF